jgi:DNA-binding NarL/FixJ family response regulator
MKAKAKSGNARTRVLVVEDHPVVRRGISNVMSRREGMEVVGEANNGEEALRMAGELYPDVILMDVDMPGLSGLDVAEKVRRDYPNVKVMLLTAHRGSDLVQRAKAAGVYAFLAKESPLEEIIGAVEAVAAGKTIEFGTGSVDVSGADVWKLTEREREVFVHIANGMRSTEIAQRLGITEESVRVHRAAVMRKLGGNSVADLTRIAVTAGLVRAESAFE